jgi:calcineurin-like phosphoesterase family protein
VKKIKIDSTKPLWFTSDTHFGHANILRYCSRTRNHFRNIDEHDDGLVEKWNARVGKDDTVFHLGDFAFMKPSKFSDLVFRLNGQIHFVHGNHDKLDDSHYKNRFAFIEDDIVELEVDQPRTSEGLKLKYSVQPIVLCHYPFQTWNRMYYGAWHLHGHCHGTLPQNNELARLDVGVDVHALAPVSFAEVRDIFEPRANRFIKDNRRKD